MMEEQKKPEGQSSEVKEEKKASDSLRMVGKIIIGLILIALGVWAVIGWWDSLKTVFKGCVGLFSILTGLIFIAIARD